MRDNIGWKQMNNMDLQRRIVEYFKDRGEVLAVYLFGSFAKERQNRDSDIDLGILLKHEFISNECKFHRIYLPGLTKQIRKDIHIVFMNNTGEGILSQIFKYGRCIVNNSPEELTRFKMTRYSMIADFSYQKNIMEKGFLENYFGENR
jgi:predicted nucleotidyltransferase